MSDPAISITDLGFRYLSREDWALTNITLAVQRNEFFGITGPSGAGKSTLCLTLSGLIPHVIEGTLRGIVRVCGLETSRNAISDLSNAVGIVFQDPRSQLTGASMTVEEEVAFGLQNLGVPRDIMLNRIREALQVVGLSGFEARSPFELSGGEQQRLSLATVIAMRPQVLVLDEPTEMLDPEGLVEVMKAVHAIHQTYKMTSVLVSNQPELLLTYAQRIATLSKGKIISTDTPREFSRKVRFLEEIGVRPAQVSQLAAFLDEKGLWNGEYPIDETQAAEIIEKRIPGKIN
jgi:energy-coupling factor transport system ATP-binding protein